MAAFFAATVCALVAGPRAAAEIRLPDFGDSSSTVFSSAAERDVGAQFMRYLRSNVEIVEDPEIESYVQSLGYKLASLAQRQDLAFTFFVVKDPAINAFAAPGGWVGLNTGLIAAAESESELASVVAHEISHVTQRHIARSLQQSERSNIAVLAGMLAAIAIGTQSAEAGQAAAAAVLGSQVQNRLNFSRAYENEADRVGMQLLDGAGFDPAAMAVFFEKLQGASRYYRRPPEYLSTHPVTSARIAEARSRAAQLGFRQHTDSDRFRMVRAKVRFLMERDNERLLAEFNEELQRNAPAPSPGSRYGIALVKARMGRVGEAREELEVLAKERPNDTAVRVALADVARRDGQEAKALRMLDDSWRLLPDSRLVTRAYVKALLATGQPKQALRVLEEHQRLMGLDTEMLRQRAEALETLGRTAESQAALAEHFYRKGELDRAIHQLTLAAQQPSNDFYRASRIEARLEQLRDEQAARARR